MQGAQILRSEAYLELRRNDEGCSATPQMDFLRSHQPWYYKWSSAGAHVRGCDDNLVHVLPFLEIVEDWRGFIGEDVSTEEMGCFRLHERTGRPLGDEAFLEGVEGLVSRVLRRQKPGQKKKDMDN